MNRQRVAMATVWVAFTAGCAVGPDYQQPGVNLPAHWASLLAGGETNRPAAVAAWWRTFQDPELDSLITRAVPSNLDLHVAEARVREARAQRGVVAAGLWPTLDISASYSRQRYSENGFPPLPLTVSPDANLYETGFDARWELDVFGGTRRAVEAADAEIGAAEYGRRAVLLSLLAEVARNYIETRGFQQRLAITHQNIQAQQEVLAITRERFKVGLSSDLDVQQSAALLATTQAQVPSLETSFQQAVHRLGVLLGRAPGTLVEELIQAKPIPPAPPEVPVGLPSELLRRRPDIQRAERELAAATAFIGVAVAELLPRFSLTGTIGLQSVSTGSWFTGGSRFWLVGPTVQWNLFDAGRVRANIRVQDARQEQALALYQQTVLSSLEDVENALTAYAKEQIHRQSLAAAVQANQQALELANQLYQSGLADFLRVLDSERSLYVAQDALVQSERTISVNLVALYKALGGGWESQ